MRGILVSQGCHLTFLGAPTIDATHRRAEQPIRPAVVIRKACGGNRSARGAQTQQAYSLSDAVSPLGTARPTRPIGGGSIMPPSRGPSHQPPRVTAPGRPVMYLRMVLAWQPAATACRANHTSDI